MDDGVLLTSAQVCQVADATYRQLDHAVKTGLLSVDGQGRDKRSGPGSVRLFTVDTAVAMAALITLRNALNPVNGLTDEVEQALVDHVINRFPGPLFTYRSGDGMVRIAVDALSVRERVVRRLSDVGDVAVSYRVAPKAGTDG